MTNHEILEIFRDRKVIEVKDYRPLDADLLPKNKQGIIIWTEQGDTLVFFPGMHKTKRPAGKRTRFEAITESPTRLAYFLQDVRCDVGHYKYDEYPPAADPEEMERWFSEECEWS